MPTCRYLHLDVFTDRPFEGNQLAVFPEPAGLSAETMQAIAREMNFSECTFILPPRASGDVWMRIFTPGAELPMAGHPTIGSTFALAHEGVIAPARTSFVFELGVGPTPVSLEWGPEGLEFAWMTQPLPTFDAVLRDRSTLASALGLGRRDMTERLPAQVVSCGVPFLFVALVSRQAVDGVSIERRALAACFSQAGVPDLPVFLFTMDRSDEATVYSRMLAPSLGVAEDPATGAASGPLGCYLFRHGLVAPDEALSMVSLQGVAMKRPSRVHISIDTAGADVTRVRIGGRSVLVGRGELDVGVQRPEER